MKYRKITVALLAAVALLLFGTASAIGKGTPPLSADVINTALDQAKAKYNELQ